jgi:ribonuclease BN (tRNA processing enzyme)
MAFGILALGHGGGVPRPIPGTPVGHDAGNTNFALIPDFDFDWLDGRMQNIPGTPMWSGNHRTWELLRKFPFYLIDCGPETALHLCGVFRDGPAARNLEGIFLTHTHDDHSGGIKSLAYRTKFIENTMPTLYYPTELTEILQSQMAEFAYLNPTVPSSEHGVRFFYNLCPIGDTSVVGFDNFHIQPFKVSHNCFNHKGEPFPAFGYQVTTPGGKKIVFSGDTAFPIGNVELHDADLLIHDVQFYNDGSKNDHVHCPYAKLRDWTPPEQRHKVYLTHTGHDLPPEVAQDGFAGLFRGGMLAVIDN